MNTTTTARQTHDPRGHHHLTLSDVAFIHTLSVTPSAALALAPSLIHPLLLCLPVRVGRCYRALRSTLNPTLICSNLEYEGF